MKNNSGAVFNLDGVRLQYAHCGCMCMFVYVDDDVCKYAYTYLQLYVFVYVYNIYVFNTPTLITVFSGRSAVESQMYVF